MKSAARSPRILITRLSHIGDCVLTIPLAHAIRRQLPNAQIVWACESPSDQLLRRCSAIDDIVLVPRRWIKNPGCWRGLRRQLRSYRFDIAIDPQGITKSALLAWISGARRRIGIRGRWGRELSPWLNNRLVQTAQDHVVDRTLELLEPLGVQPGAPCFELQVDPASQQRMREFLRESSIQPPFAIINPGASWSSRRWEPDRFAQLANRLSQQFSLHSIVVWAGDQEQQMAGTIDALTDSRCVIAPPTSLSELAALCDGRGGPRLLVSADTGPLHIASAMGTACIGLHGTTRPRDSGAYGSQHISLQAWYQSGTTRERRSSSNLAMRDISVDQVVEAATELLGRFSTAREQAAVA